MRPFYNRANTNFGDHMNSWLWEELVPGLVHDDDDIRLIGIGSLLSRNLDLVPGPKVVFGTGSGYSSLPLPAQAAAWDVYCVRGPLTAHHLGLDPRKAITDGAWLINRLPRYAAVPTDKRGTVFVPHHTTAAAGVWAGICARSDIAYVDPLSDCDTVFTALAKAELAIVESLHGAIIADYFRTPWIAVASPGRVLKFKWLDWCSSLELDYRPYLLPPSDYVDCLLQGQPRTDLPERPVAMEVAKDTFDVSSTPPPPARAGAAYRARTHAKSVLRKARGTTFDLLEFVRGGALFRNWNERHAARTSGYLDALKSQRPSLSSDRIRATRLEQLNEALERMERRYGGAAG